MRLVVGSVIDLTISTTKKIRQALLNSLLNTLVGYRDPA